MDNIKIAFAEGYLAATNSDESPKSGKTMKYLKVSALGLIHVENLIKILKYFSKVFQQLLVIVVFIGIFLSLFSSSNGSMFRYVFFLNLYTFL